MNLDALWQTHRRFLLGVAGALVLFLAAEALIGSTSRSRLLAAERRIRAGRSALGQPAYDANAESQVRKRLDALQAQVGALAAEALPPWRAGFRPAGGESPTQFYIERTGALRQELVAWAWRADVEVDAALGMPAVSPTEPQKIERVLRGVDVVERVVRIAVGAGARAVEDIAIQLRAASSRRRAGGRRTELDLTPVTLTVVLPDAAAFPFLLQVVQADPPLGLEGLELGALDRRTQARRVVLEFAVGTPPPVGAESQ